MSNHNSDTSATDEYDTYPNIEPDPNSTIIIINESTIDTSTIDVEDQMENGESLTHNIEQILNLTHGPIGTNDTIDSYNTSNSDGNSGTSGSSGSSGSEMTSNHNKIPVELKKIRKKKRKQLHEEEKKPKDKCLFCHGRISEEDKYFPCNCRFGFVHRECLRQWAFVDGHLYCQVCKLRYHLERQNGVCFVCNSANQEKPLIKPCKCLYITVHSDCINQWYTQSNNNHKCKYCDYEYKIVTQVSRKFTKSRIPIVLWTLGIIAYLLFAIFLIAGTDLISAIDPSIKYPRFDYTYNGTVPDGVSRVLFPGNNTQACYALEIMYLITIGFVSLIALCALGAWGINMVISTMKKTDTDVEYMHQNKVWLHKNKWALFLGPLVSIPLLHLLGNIHYLIYARVNLISPINSFWMYNGYSFITGPAGLIVIMLIIGFGLFLYMTFKGIYWLLVKENKQIEVVVPDVVGF